MVLDGAGLDADAVTRIADRTAVPTVPPEALARADRSWRAARQAAAAGRMYGRHTGVGANRLVPVSDEDQAGQDLRLLRSHAGGVGALLPARQVRAALAVRANQALAGGSALQPAVVQALVEALRLGVHPAVSEYGAVGTGDLTALAETGLALIGERPWLHEDLGRLPDPADAFREGLWPSPSPQSSPSPSFSPQSTPSSSRAPSPSPSPSSGPSPDGEVPPSAGGLDPAVALDPAAVPAPFPGRVTLQQGDALALMSSSAFTLGQAALVCHDLDILLRASHAVTALSLAAVSGSLEAYAAPALAIRPYPGALRAGAEVRRLLGVPDRPRATGRRIQDPYGFRAFPQVHGPALEAAWALRRILDVEVNCPSENPLIGEEGPDGGPVAYHHGGFMATPVGLALDHLCLAVLQTAQLSAARLTAFGDPEITGLRSYLAGGSAASSGMMILEYSANSALAEIRASAAPASAGHAVLSRGVEEAASFASQATRQALRAVDAYRLVLACELVAAVRALRLHPALPALSAGAGTHAPVFAVLDSALPTATEDRALTPDVSLAVDLLPELAAL
ncbi:aromatic amino acid ammonia-lyase [Streptomyces sp. NPDC093221]|uniref:aromatic amino acid ammonia-lyase n=1 Tax=Streptomyces sp. NPDC093221 TaxID=3366032 RepID=UPI003805018B